jgi:hypothetical protein
MKLSPFRSNDVSNQLYVVPIPNFFKYWCQDEQILKLAEIPEHLPALYNYRLGLFLRENRFTVEKDFRRHEANVANEMLQAVESNPETSYKRYLGLIHRYIDLLESHPLSVAKVFELNQADDVDNDDQPERDWHENPYTDLDQIFKKRSYIKTGYSLLKKVTPRVTGQNRNDKSCLIEWLGCLQNKNIVHGNSLANNRGIAFLLKRKFNMHTFDIKTLTDHFNKKRGRSLEEKPKPLQGEKHNDEFYALIDTLFK